jgi:hypothetical protein
MKATPEMKSPRCAPSYREIAVAGHRIVVAAAETKSAMTAAIGSVPTVRGS